MVFRTGLMGYASYYLMTGKPPQRLKDAFFPGGHSRPDFLRDAVNRATHPVDSAVGKIHLTATLIRDMMNNYAKYVAEQYVPLALRDAVQGKPAEGRPLPVLRDSERTAGGAGREALITPKSCIIPS
jgi:hypothetical protein